MRSGLQRADIEGNITRGVNGALEALLSSRKLIILVSIHHLVQTFMSQK